MRSGEDSSDSDGRADSPTLSKTKRGASPIRTALACSATAGLVVLALLSVVDGFGWIGEIVSNLGWRLATVGFVVAGFQFRCKPLAAASLLAAVVALLPTVILSPRAPAAGHSQGVTVRILIANPLASNDDPDALLALLAASEADVLVLTEPPRAVRQALRPGGALSDRFVDIARTRPDRGAHAPIVVASRLPMIESIQTGAGINAVILRAGNTDFGLVATQLLSPRSAGRNDIANIQADEVAILGRALSARGLPLVIAGDLNSAPTGHRARRLASATETASAKPRWRLGGTWPARLPASLGLPIDGAMVSHEVSVARWELTDLPGSDHRGVLIGLTISPERRNNTHDLGGDSPDP